MKIGVTGHQRRDGIDWNWVRHHIDLYLIGKPIITGYSSLAAGTDQIFADAVLDRGGKLVAVIPIPKYIDHFQDEALKRFKQLRSVSHIIELNSHKSDNWAFLDAGKWIAREAERIIAVWDGEPAAGAGGTGDVVAYALSLGRLVHHIDPIKEAVTDI